MTRQSKSALSAGEATELIAEVQASDRAAARSAISDGVRTAQDQWLEAPLIAEALARELVEVASTTRHSSAIAAYLRQLAELVENRTDLH